MSRLAGCVRQARSKLRDLAVRIRSRIAPGYMRRKAFSDIYNAGGWRGISQTASGSGSTMDQTDRLRHELPRLLAALGVRSLLDAPCGDLHWMQACPIDVDEYIGLDIVPQLVADNAQRFGGGNRRFAVADLAVDTLPRTHVILCRDCLVHLPLRDAVAVVRNFRRSGSDYLLSTTFPDTTANDELIQAGGWRPLNLELPPFDLGPPLRLLNEGTTEYGDRYRDKSLGLWRLDQTPVDGDRQ
jgi:hypothetical protein